MYSVESRKIYKGQAKNGLPEIASKENQVF